MSSRRARRNRAWEADRPRRELEAEAYAAIRRDPSLIPQSIPPGPHPGKLLPPPESAALGRRLLIEAGGTPHDLRESEVGDLPEHPGWIETHDL